MNKIFLKKKIIYHCSSFSVDGKEGSEKYLNSLLTYQVRNISINIGKYVIKSLKNIDQNQFQLLHIHTPDILWEVTGEGLVIYTVHNHSPYYPSGTKHLMRQHLTCGRNFSYLGSFWGILADSCGSQRPFIPVNHIKKLADAITSLFNDYQAARCMGEQGHALLMKEFTMDLHIKRLQKIYEKIINSISFK